MTKKEQCCVIGCKNKVLVHKHTLCGAHYARYLKWGEPGEPAIKKKRSVPRYNPKEEPVQP